MTNRTVGPNSDFSSISTAMDMAVASDVITLQPHYSNETASVTRNNLTVFGTATSTGIVLDLALGVSVFTLTGTAAINILDSSGANGIVGNDGNNRITVTGGADAVNGGLGVDTLIVDYRLATGAITGDSTSNFSEAGGGGRTVTVTDGTIEHFVIYTGAGADTITTGAGDDQIYTFGGASTVSAGQGANVIIGGKNADTITALDGGNYIDAGDGANKITSGGGNDRLFSGIGTDTIVAGGGADSIRLSGGADTVSGGAGTDRIVVDYSALKANVTGGLTSGNLATGYVGHIGDGATNTINFTTSENFTITTGSGNDFIKTGAGNDALHGGLGNDTLNGRTGKDTIYGDAGDDHILSGLGTDHLTGGLGADTFVFHTAAEAGYGSLMDVIYDFVSGTDRIDLSAIDADSVANGVQNFTFIGTEAYSKTAGQLHLWNDTLAGDTDGDGKADFTIDIANFSQISHGDLIL